MLTLPPSVRIYVATEPVDLRKQFDGLALLVEQGLKEDPRSGHLYVFRNQRGSHVRILFCVGDHVDPKKNGPASPTRKKLTSRCASAEREPEQKGR